MGGCANHRCYPRREPGVLIRGIAGSQIAVDIRVIIGARDVLLAWAGH